jgi:hypothetical protein
MIKAFDDWKKRLQEKEPARVWRHEFCTYEEVWRAALEWVLTKNTCCVDCTTNSIEEELDES